MTRITISRWVIVQISRVTWSVPTEYKELCCFQDKKKGTPKEAASYIPFGYPDGWDVSVWVVIVASDFATPIHRQDRQRVEGKGLQQGYIGLWEGIGSPP
jgi:hypothetical protein|mmetsp:Transcript_21820/g.36431  ORF Transcript_21820/g.36431 Transcript_21820/m.36431 type:complete len:100 (-) Transcript_21820:1543-1842(-)